MIGGQIIIDFKGINITSSSLEIPAYIMRKIVRALDLQKELVFENLKINGKKISSCSPIVADTELFVENTRRVYVFDFWTRNSSTGDTEHYQINFYSDNTVVARVIT